jgi:carbonic anhydrase
MARTLLGFLLVCAVGCASAEVVANAPGAASGAAPHGAAVDAAQALALLQAGNERFATATMSSSKPTAARRAETAETQHPFAVVVGCADSRTAPEIVFDQNLGDLFTVRTAGNLVDRYALGSIEYAVQHLGARLIVVLGHERCGAVKAALGATDAEGHVGDLVRDLQAAVSLSKARSGDPLELAVEENATLVAQRISDEANFGEHKAEVRVVEGYYDLDTGRVRWRTPR